MGDMVEVHSLSNIVPDPSWNDFGGYTEPDFNCEYCGESFHTEAEADAHDLDCHEAKKFRALYSDEGAKHLLAELSEPQEDGTDGHE